MQGLLRTSGNDFQPEVSLNGSLGNFRLVRLQAKGQGCVALRRYDNHNWPISDVEVGGRDIAMGNTRLLGVYCAARGATISDNELEALVDGLN